MTRRAWLLLALLAVSAVAAWRLNQHGHGVHGHFSMGGATAAEVQASMAAAPFSVKEIGRVNAPTALTEPPAGPAGVWAMEQAGTIQRVAGGKNSLILDIHERVSSGGETGLLGIAIHPNFPADPRVFLNYTRNDRGGLHTVVASFRTDDGGQTLNPRSEKLVLTFDQPYSNHNSGSLDFGADGKLYIAIGDGGAGGDPEKHGQNLGDWLGSILRVDIATEPYTVPPDNPFATGAGAHGEKGVLPEIWAYGVRNPWGMHFDGDTLWFADVGQDSWEEVDRGVVGGNYGWNMREASHCFERNDCSGTFVEPVAEYKHDVGTSVTGGFVIRDPAIPALDGKYLFADFTTGRFMAVNAEGGPLEKLVESKIHPSTFGRDRAGRYYVADYLSGAVLQLGP